MKTQANIYPCPACNGVGDMGNGKLEQMGNVTIFDTPTPCRVCGGKGQVAVLPLPDGNAANELRFAYDRLPDTVKDEVFCLLAEMLYCRSVGFGLPSFDTRCKEISDIFYRELGLEIAEYT